MQLVHKPVDHWENPFAPTDYDALSTIGTLDSETQTMAIGVVEFSREGDKIRKVFA